MRTLVLNVRVEQFGAGFRGIVASGSGPAGAPLAVVIRDDAHTATIDAFREAAQKVAEDLTR